MPSTVAIMIYGLIVPPTFWPDFASSWSLMWLVEFFDSLRARYISRGKHQWQRGEDKMENMYVCLYRAGDFTIFKYPRHEPEVRIAGGTPLTIMSEGPEHLNLGVCDMSGDRKASWYTESCVMPSDQTQF
jgi:hypothetical protein